MHLSVKRFAGLFFVTLCLFPWVNFGLNDLDTQPWHIIAGSFFLALNWDTKMPRRVMFVLMLPFVAVLVGLATTRQFDFLTFRGAANYISFSVTFIAYYLYRRQYGMPWGIFYTANVIWWISGVAEVVINPYIFEAFVSTRTTLSRGVTGLAAEPTFFGIFLFFISWLYLVESDYKPKRTTFFFVAVNVLFIALVAKSTMAVLMIVVALAALLIREFKPRRILKAFVVMLGAALVVSVVVVYMPSSRLAVLLTKIPTVGLLVAHYDASINARLAHVVLSLEGFISNFGIPQGFNSFSAASFELANLSVNEGFFTWGLGSPIIMSFVGASLYELGWFGVLFVLCLAETMRTGKGMRVESWFLVVILLAAVPINLPLVAALTATGLLRWERLKVTARNTPAPQPVLLPAMRVSSRIQKRRQEI